MCSSVKIGDKTAVIDCKPMGERDQRLTLDMVSEREQQEQQENC